jgi:hypothetical protein
VVLIGTNDDGGGVGILRFILLSSIRSVLEFIQDGSSLICKRK